MGVALGELLVKARLISGEQLKAALSHRQAMGGSLVDALLAQGALGPDDLKRLFHRALPAPRSVEQTGLPHNLLIDLLLKIAYFQGQVFSIPDMAVKLRLPAKVVDEMVALAKNDRLVVVRSGNGYGRLGHQFELTALGLERCEKALRQSRYMGPAPVPIAVYREVVAHQTVRQIEIDAGLMRSALSELVIGEKLQTQLGTAFNSGRSVFLYGPAGTGKSTMAEALGRSLPGDVYIPFAVEIDGQIIRILDPAVHIAVDEEAADPDAPVSLTAEPRHDPRWRLCHRPVVIAGGELTLQGLDLEYDPVGQLYECPAHIKATNGVFILDDFGRQQVTPRQLLNRWMTPMERGTDFLTMHNGMKVEFPFDQVTIFSSNLDPRELVDLAFLRRIRYKIRVPNPPEEDYREVLRRVCQVRGIECTPEFADYLVKTCYRDKDRAFVGSHPRDLVEQIIDRAFYLHQSPELSKQALDAVAASYFVDP